MPYGTPIGSIQYSLGTDSRRIREGSRRVREDIQESKNVRRVRGWVHNGFKNGFGLRPFATDSREFVRDRVRESVLESSRHGVRQTQRISARVRQSSPEFAAEFARVREGSREDYMDGFTTAIYGRFAD